MKGDGKKFLGSFMANAMELEKMNGNQEWTLVRQVKVLKN